jgi:hypothetical protein
MAQVFISYAREDRAFAEGLANWLEAEGWTAWWDTQILAGNTFRNTIERELAAARCLIVVWTPASITSHWVIDEAQAGAERNVLLPLAINDVKIPLGLRQTQAVPLARRWDVNHNNI